MTEKTEIQRIRMKKGKTKTKRREEEKLRLQQFQKGIDEYLQGE